MNDIVVGVKPVTPNGTVAQPGEGAASVGALWVTIDGKEMPTDGHGGLISVKAAAEAGLLKVTIELIGRTVQFVDYRDPQAAPERFKKQRTGTLRPTS